MGLLLWLIPVLAVLLSIVIKKKTLLHVINAGTAFLLLVITCFATKQVIDNGFLSYQTMNGLFFLDSVSIIILNIIVWIGFFVSVYSIGYLEEERKRGIIQESKIRLYYILMFSFLFTMILALTVNNIGVLWIAIEGTTLASAFLVGFHKDRHAIEAAWKYVTICSVGIAVALLGIIFLHLSSVDAIDPIQALRWDVLYQRAEHLNSPILRLSFIFIVIGFGTKIGLVPMHTWLPDAHSQAPSPISALLSGVLLNSALYALIRALSIVNRNLGNSSFTGEILIGFGLLSIAASAVFILTQKDYKRLLAYSSIEHMGLITLSVGIFTPLSVFAAFYHMINHSLTKSLLFLASGNILQKYETRDISKINGLLKVLPVSGTAFFLGLFAISGAPPFSVFASEISLLISVFRTNRLLMGTALVLLLAVIFAGIASVLFKMFYQDTSSEQASVTVRQPGETNRPGAAVILILLVLISVTGIFLPDFLKDLITSAQRIVIGG